MSAIPPSMHSKRGDWLTCIGMASKAAAKELSRLRKNQCKQAWRQRQAK